MNINHLFYFRSVCETGSITAAAELCHISQPSITSAIHNLETETGLHLFNRTGNHIFLTDDGKQFLNITLGFLNQYEDYQKNITDIASQKTSVLKLGVPTILGTFLFGKIIPFESSHNNIRLKIYETGSISGLDMLKKGELDCMIGLSDNSSDSKTNSKLLFTTELQLAINQNHAFAKSKLASKEMLSELPIVSLYKGSYHYKAVTQRYPETVSNIIMYSNQVSTIREMLSSMNAGAIIYKEVFSDCDEIVYLPLENPITANVSVIYPKDRYISNSLKAFINYISKAFNN